MLSVCRGYREEVFIVEGRIGRIGCVGAWGDNGRRKREAPVRGAGALVCVTI